MVTVGRLKFWRRLGFPIAEIEKSIVVKLLIEVQVILLHQFPRILIVGFRNKVPRVFRHLLRRGPLHDIVVNIIMMFDANIAHEVCLDLLVGVPPEKFHGCDKAKDQNAYRDDRGDVEAECVKKEPRNNAVARNECFQDVCWELGELHGAIDVCNIAMFQGFEIFARHDAVSCRGLVFEDYKYDSVLWPLCWLYGLGWAVLCA